MENMKQRLIEFMKGKEKVHLSDVYQNFTDIQTASIRATLNISIKKGENIFERLGSGNYKLK